MSTLVTTEAAVPAKPALTQTGMRLRSYRRAALSILLAAAAYEVVARSGYFAPALLPTIPIIMSRLFAMLVDGSMWLHAGFTLYRVLFGFGLAMVVGIPLGILMARYRRVENFFLPLVSALMPIPSFSLLPLFLLWFGIGNMTTILIVFYASTFPMLFNTWSGVRSVNPLWLRAAGAMGADEHKLFWKVIIPGSSPFIITGMRQAFLRSWIAVIGAEMIAASDWGLGWVIFDSKEFLQTDIMLASVAVIGFIGFVFERAVFGVLERTTVQRWGMVRTAKG
jgi:NitT/TauT family transport system permease protein